MIERMSAGCLHGASCRLSDRARMLAHRGHPRGISGDMTGRDLQTLTANTCAIQLRRVIALRDFAATECSHSTLMHACCRAACARDIATDKLLLVADSLRCAPSWHSMRQMHGKRFLRFVTRQPAMLGSLAALLGQPPSDSAALDCEHSPEGPGATCTGRSSGAVAVATRCECPPPG